MIWDVKFMYKYGNTYVMDNHVGAAWCWLQCCDTNENYNFLHIDCHPDLQQCFNKDFIPIVKQDKGMNLNSYLNLKYTDGLGLQMHCFTWNNYILNINDIYPNWFENALFITHNYIDDSKLHEGWEKRPFDFLFDGDLVRKLATFANNCNKWIINIDLDFAFNYVSEDEELVQVISDEKISLLASSINELMSISQAVTIALSPECCGGEGKAKHVFELFKQKIEALKGERTVVK